MTTEETWAYVGAGGGWTVNHKKIQRLWREEGLRGPPARKSKRRRPGSSDGVLLRAEHPNHEGLSTSSSTRPQISVVSSCRTLSTSTPGSGP